MRWRVAILALPCSLFLALCLGHNEAWLHPEQIRASAYIWLAPNDLGAVLGKSFDWAALDTSNPMQWKALEPAHRVRPVSDILQVVDAIGRAALSTVYPHPSLTPSAIVAALLAPAFLFAFVRLVTGSTLAAAFLTGLWISGMGFNSTIIPDLHSGAKRFALLFLCTCLYLAERHRRSGDARTFALFIGLLFVSLFTDEMALGAYVALVALYWRGLERWKLVPLGSLPIMYLLVVAFAMPAFYAAVAVDGTPPFQPLDAKKGGILWNLSDLGFYELALSQTARAILTSVGTIRHGPVLEAIALMILAVGTAYGWRKGSYATVSTAAVLLANGVYLTLLDQYVPGGHNYIPAYGYYYHSSLGLLLIVWLAFLLTTIRMPRWSLGVITPAYVVVVVLNFQNFHAINQLVALAHTYPHQVTELYRIVRAPGPVLTFPADCRANTERFNEKFEAVRGERFAESFQKAHAHLWLSRDDLGYLMTAHYPGRQFTVKTDLVRCEKGPR